MAAVLVRLKGRVTVAGVDVTLNFDAYLKALAATPIDAKTEHTDRGAL